MSYPRKPVSFRKLAFIALVAIVLPLKTLADQEYEVLKWFSPAGPGAYPYASVIEGTDGALSGTTEDDYSHDGVVFKLNKDGTGYCVLHAFSAADPRAAVIEASNGMLYTAELTGGYSGGSVF